MVAISYEISGKGWLRAVQESIDTKRNICSVTDIDSFGNLVRIGYCFLSRETGKRIGPITWFKQGQVFVKKIEGDGQKPGTGVARVNFKHLKKNERHFILQIPIGRRQFRIRGITRLLKDKSKIFVIMLDRQMDDKEKTWKGIIRYDCAHGFIHKDIINKDGKKVKNKIPLPVQDKKKAIRMATKEVIKDLKIWSLREGVETFQKGKIAGHDVFQDLVSAEKKLIETLGKESSFDSTESSAALFSSQVSEGSIES